MNPSVASGAMTMTSKRARLTGFAHLTLSLFCVTLSMIFSDASFEFFTLDFFHFATQLSMLFTCVSYLVAFTIQPA